MLVLQETTGFGQWRNITRFYDKREARRELRKARKAAKAHKRIKYQYRLVPG